jgi:hypothetical protein
MSFLTIQKAVSPQKNNRFWNGTCSIARAKRYETEKTINNSNDHRLSGASFFSCQILGGEGDVSLQPFRLYGSDSVQLGKSLCRQREKRKK